MTDICIFAHRFPTTHRRGVAWLTLWSRHRAAVCLPTPAAEHVCLVTGQLAHWTWQHSLAQNARVVVWHYNTHLTSSNSAVHRSATRRTGRNPPRGGDPLAACTQPLCAVTNLQANPLALLKTNLLNIPPKTLPNIKSSWLWQPHC